MLNETIGASAYDPTAVYDRVTQAWLLLLGDDLHYGYFERADMPLADATRALTFRMAERAAMAPGTSVLDVGCGVGHPARFLARNFGCHVTGISPSRVGIGQAAEFTKLANLTHLVSFEERDGMANGFPDATFDLVWIMESSHLMPHKDRLIAESARVLRPGGKLVWCDIVLRDSIPLDQLVRNLKAFKALDAVFGKAKMELMETYRRLCERTGLTVERCDDISDAVLPTFNRWRENAHANRVRVVDLVGYEYWRQFVDSCDFLTTLWNQNDLGYAMMVGRK